MDIVKYLRANQEGWHDPDIVWVQVSAARVKEAADEIERLRVENEYLLKLANKARLALNLILNHPVEESKQWEVAVREMKKLSRDAFDEDE